MNVMKGVIGLTVNPYSQYPSSSQVLPYASTGFNPWLVGQNGPYETMRMPSYNNYTHNVEERKNICKIRFYHGASSIELVDIYINGMKTFKELPFNVASSFLSMAPGTYYVEVFPSGTTYPLIMHRKITIGNTPNTIVLTGSKANLRLIVLPENHFVPQNESKVKTLHLAPSYKTLQVCVKGRDTLYQSLPYKHQTDYLGLTPMSIAFELKDTEENKLLYHSDYFQFEPNKVYMMIIYEGEAGKLGIKLLDEA
ncbi:DUF4397 domain-containing protein [Pradoshia sp.]